MPIYGSILPFRNKLAYPAGMAAGFDPTHVASPNTVFSFVCTSPGNLTNIFNGSSGTNSLTTANILASIGPAVGYSNTAVCETTLSAPLVSSTTALTMAVIVQFSTIAAAYQALISNKNNNLIVLSPSSFFGFYLNGDLDSSFVPAANVPYFLVASVNAAFKANFLVVNLQTGSVVTQSVTGSGNSFSAPTAWWVGNNASQPAKAIIAAGMVSYSYLSISALQTWGANPWVFWYPRTPIDWVGKVAVAAPIAFVRRNIIRASAKGFR